MSGVINVCVINVVQSIFTKGMNLTKSANAQNVLKWILYQLNVVRQQNLLFTQLVAEMEKA